MEQPYQCTGAKTKFRPKLPPAQIAPAYYLCHFSENIVQMWVKSLSVRKSDT